MSYPLLAAAAIALFVVLRTVWRVRRANASQTWPEAAGVIDESSIIEVAKEEDRESFRPQVSYRYTVAGQEHTGKKISFERVDHESREAARAVIRNYTPGAAVQVRYDPKRPGNSVLELSSPRNLMLAVAVEIVVAIVVIGFLVKMYAGK